MSILISALMMPTYQSLSNVQHRIAFDANTPNSKQVSSFKQRGRTTRRKRIFSTHWTFFITVRCLDFRKKYSNVFSVHCSQRLILIRWKCTNNVGKENTDHNHNECKGKGILMKVIALWAFWAPRKSRRNDEWERWNDKTSEQQQLD